MATHKTRKSAAKPPEKKHPLPANGAKLAEMERYGLFMAIPRKERKAIFGYETDQGFAKDYGVSPQTLSEWKWTEQLWQIRDKYLVHFKKRTANILSKLADRAERTGEAFHTLTYMKLIEGYSEKTGIDLTSKGKRISGFRLILHEPKRRSDSKGSGE